MLAGDGVVLVDAPTEPAPEPEPPDRREPLLRRPSRLRVDGRVGVLVVDVARRAWSVGSARRRASWRDVVVAVPVLVVCRRGRGRAVRTVSDTNSVVPAAHRGAGAGAGAEEPEDPSNRSVLERGELILGGGQVELGLVDGQLGRGRIQRAPAVGPGGRAGRRGR